MTTIHLIHGEATAAALQQAIQSAARADRVIALRDDLTVGPLRDIDETRDAAVTQRAEFWALLGGVPDTLTLDDCEALDALTLADTNVVVWHTHDAAHQLTLRRICYRLRCAPQRLNEVRLAADELAPARLEARLPDAAPISVLRITRLALEWQEAKFANGETRRWRDNTFTSGTWADLDTLILDVLDTAHAQRPADAPWLTSDALGAALTRAGAGFSVAEPVVLWRLRELAAAEELRLRDDMCASCAPSAAESRSRAARLALPQTAAHLSLSR